MIRHARWTSFGALSVALAVAACSPKDSADGGAAAGGGAPAASPSSGGGTIDERTLGSYPLTMDKLNRTIKAAQNIEAAEEANPGLEDRWQKDDDDDLDDIRTDLPELIGRIEAEPPIRQAVESAGISPRDFVLTTFAVMSASVAAEMKKSGAKQDSGIGAHVSDDNIAFVTAHRAEIQRLMQAAK